MEDKEAEDSEVEDDEINGNGSEGKNAAKWYLCWELFYFVNNWKTVLFACNIFLKKCMDRCKYLDTLAP
jgi:hypothetical protein